ncbi:MAG TPA: LysR substrate-binding domain-containing protein [Acidimicrobiales bacterium]|nr:LysR substrate-binding domain-containing protein [Acidimicrobiales bacterium]
MDLRSLGYVVAIVDEGGFGRAAATLGVTQPSLSHAVKALENELGTQLFHRLGRSVTLTSAGEALLGPARQALRDAEVARAAVAAVVGLSSGRLDLVCLPTLAVDPVADLVGRFRAQHPGVRVQIEEPEDADAVAALVRTGASELGFAELPLRVPDLEAIELAAHEFVAVLPRSYTGGVEARLTIAELADMPLVTTPVGTSTRRQIDEAFTAAGLTPTVAVETDHREAIVAMVLAGAGVAILPEPVATASRAAGAVVRPISPTITRRVGLIRRPGPLSPAAQAFTALAVPGAPSSPARPRARRRRSIATTKATR